MPLEQVHITQGYATVFPGATQRLDPDGDGWIDLDKIARLDLKEQAYLFTDLYRQPEYESFDFNYWKTYAGLKEGGMEKIGNLLWAADAKTAAKMKAPKNQRPIKLQFPIMIEPPYDQNEKTSNLLTVALESLLAVGPPSGRPDPFVKQVFPFVPQWEAVSIIFTTKEAAARILPSSKKEEFLNGTFDAFSISVPGEEGPVLIVFLIGDRLLTPDSEEPGRFMTKLITILAHEIYGNVATMLSGQEIDRQRQETIAFQTGIDFITKLLNNLPSLPEHLGKEFKKQRELESAGLEAWKRQAP